MIQVPDGWEIKPLKDILSIQYGKDQKEVELVNGKYPILGSGGVIGYTNHFLYDKPSVLIGRKETINNPQYMETPFWTVDTLFYSHIKNKNVPKWVYYVFQSINWDSYNEASGVPSLSTANINRIEILRPIIKEQEKIAKILSTLDNAIESTTRIIEKEKNIKTALMQELLTNGIDKNGQIRTPQTHTYKQSELGLIPDEWEVDSIENHAKIITGNKDTQDRLDDGGYPFYVRSQTIERINTYSFDGEAVLTAGDGVGVGKVFHFVNEKFDFHQRVYCIHDFSEKLNSSFFFEYFRTYFIEQVNKYSAKGSVDSVRYDMIALMNIPLPTFEEQKQIAKILTTQDKKIEIEETNLDKLKELKKGLMNDLLSGVVRVKV